VILGLSEIGPRQEKEEEKEKEESLFKTNAVNEEDPERDPATQEASPKSQGPKSSEKIFKLVKVKDRFTTKQEDGYRDICLNVEVAWVSEINRTRQCQISVYMHLIWIFAI
jgi:hypothetical protein